MLLPLVERKKNTLIKVMQILGTPIAMTNGYRSFEEQERLYAQGRSTPGPIVTNARGGQSYHQYGVAFDVAFLVNGKLSWDNSLPWQRLGKWGEFIGLEWGGRWVELIDRPHFQLTKGYSLDQFKRGQVNYSLFN